MYILFHLKNEISCKLSSKKVKIVVLVAQFFRSLILGRKVYTIQSIRFCYFNLMVFVSAHFGIFLERIVNLK